MSQYLERLLALVALILVSPLFLFIYILVKLEDGGPFLFVQKRSGKGEKPFDIYKFRTMVLGAEELKPKYKALNEADGPVFKIYEDPRYTKIGRTISHVGLDELPQLINVVKGEMSFVGPRPLPVDEAKRVPKKYQIRFSVKPGLSSSWVIDGAHNLNFKEWMERDLKDVRQKGFLYNTVIAFKTAGIILKLIWQQIKKLFTSTP